MGRAVKYLMGPSTHCWLRARDKADREQCASEGGDARMPPKYVIIGGGQILPNPIGWNRRERAGDAAK